MYCKHCGAALPESSKFCPACGTAVGEVYQPAALGRRIADYLIDVFCMYILIGFPGIVLLIMADHGRSGVFTPFLFPLFLVVTMPFYWIFFEGIWQRTPGKWATGTKVVRYDGDKPKFWQIVGRSFSRVIPFEAVSFLFSMHPIGWHDRFSKTLVVPKDYTAENVQAIDFRPAKKYFRAANIVTICVASLYVVAFAGMMVLGFVISAHDAAQKDGHQAGAIFQSGEHYRSTHGDSYSGFCNDESVRAIFDDGTGTPSQHYVCNDSATAWAMSAPAHDGENDYFCTDSSGYDGVATGDIRNGETSCKNVLP